jgi:hypothetical protein
VPQHQAESHQVKLFKTKGLMTANKLRSPFLWVLFRLEQKYLIRINGLKEVGKKMGRGSDDGSVDTDETTSSVEFDVAPGNAEN